MRVETFPVGPLGCNCSILTEPRDGLALVIDPGGDFDEIEARLVAQQVRVGAILHTHAHVDHVGATAPLQRLTSAPARLHEADRFLYDMLPVQAAMLGMSPPERCEMDTDLADGTSVQVGSIELEVIHTPGHTPGGVVFLSSADGRSIAFTGDTLFRSGIGRTDLWGGSSEAILRSIRERLFTLDEDTLVVPGHGPNTTIGEERRTSPFFRRG